MAAISSYEPESDVRIRFRQDPVQNYMAPELQFTKPHFHYQFEMIYVRAGAAAFHVEDKLYDLREGSFLFLSNMENHSIAGHTPLYERYTVRISNDYLTGHIKSPLLASIFKQRPASFCHQYECRPEQREHYSHLLQIMHAEYEQQEDFWDALIASKLYDILVHLYRAQPQFFPASGDKKGQNVVYEIQNYIEGNLSEDLTLGGLAAQFYIDKFHLSHIYKDITGYTLKQYIVLQRIAKAKDALLHTNLSIGEIAGMVGFNSDTHFIRTFKGLEQVSPNQYRKGKRVPKADAGSL